MKAIAFAKTFRGQAGYGREETDRLNSLNKVILCQEPLDFDQCRILAA